MSFTESVDDITAANRNGLLGAAAHWRRVRLREVVRILNGFPFESSRFSRDQGTPLLRIRDIVPGRTETYYSGEFDSTYVVERGELVVGMDGDFNSEPWRGEPALLNQRVCKLTPDESRLLLPFLRYALPGYLAAVNAATPSVTVKHLSSKTIGDLPLPLPSLDEQRRIVAEIEKQFTRLDAGRAALERVQRNLKRYRAAVLKAACEGRLVPTEAELARAEGRTFEPASELLARILNERRATWSGRGKYKEPAAPDTSDFPVLSDGWAWASIEQVGVVGGGLTKNPARSKLPHQVPYLRVANVYHARLRLGDIEKIGVDESELAKLLLRDADLLVVEGNGSREQIGRVARWDGSIDPCVHQNHLIRVRPCVPRTSNWILFWLLSPGGRDLIERVASSTSGLYTLSVNKVAQLAVPLPPLAEQHRIVTEVERRLSVVDRLEALVTANLQRATRLRQSVLQRAFSGELVPAES